MKTEFGISSATPINKKLKNGYTMYDWVMRQKGYPSFCMRNISGEDKITSEEIEFLRENNCKIGLVIGDLTEKAVSGVNGAEDALRAIESVKELGVPQNEGIAIFANIKPDWSVNHNWMISFAQTIFDGGYVPGFIGNTDSSINFNFDRQCSHFVEATQDTNCFGAVIAASEPKCYDAPEKWEPYCPSQMQPEDIELWICGATEFDSVRVEDVYAKDEKVLDRMW